MAALLNRSRMTTATTGTGTITLGSAVSGYLSFAEAGVVNATVYAYTIQEGNDFEIGQGTYTSSGTTFSRDTVTASKISGAAGTTKMNLAGAAQIFISPRASDMILLTRTVTGTANEITVTNGDGVSGNPTLSLPTALTFTGKTVTGGTFTGITDITVADGGTGRSSHTAYAVICGGTSTTAAQQSIAAVGSSGDVLTSNGGGALPTFQAPSGGAAPALIETISTTSGTGTTGKIFDNIPDTYSRLLFVFSGVSPSGSATLQIEASINNGSSYGTVFALTGALANGNVVSGSVSIDLYSVSAAPKPFQNVNNGNATVTLMGGIIESGSGVIDAVRISLTAANFDAGSISLYGIP